MFLNSNTEIKAGFSGRGDQVNPIDPVQMEPGYACVPLYVRKGGKWQIATDDESIRSNDGNLVVARDEQGKAIVNANGQVLREEAHPEFALVAIYNYDSDKNKYVKMTVTHPTDGTVSCDVRHLYSGSINHRIFPVECAVKDANLIPEGGKKTRESAEKAWDLNVITISRGLPMVRATGSVVDIFQLMRSSNKAYEALLPKFYDVDTLPTNAPEGTRLTPLTENVKVIGAIVYTIDENRGMFTTNMFARSRNPDAPAARLVFPRNWELTTDVE